MRRKVTIFTAVGEKMPMVSFPVPPGHGKMETQGSLPSRHVSRRKVAPLESADDCTLSHYQVSSISVAGCVLAEAERSRVRGQMTPSQDRGADSDCGKEGKVTCCPLMADTKTCEWARWVCLTACHVDRSRFFRNNPHSPLPAMTKQPIAARCAHTIESLRAGALLHSGRHDRSGG
jgi:hypothetical protein